MDRLHGLIGVALILGIAVLFSNNRRKINLRLVASGISLQVIIALLIFHVGPVSWFFQKVGQGIGKIEEFARQGASFVFGGIAVHQPARAASGTTPRTASSSPSTSPPPSSWSARWWP